MKNTNADRATGQTAVTAVKPKKSRKPAGSATPIVGLLPLVIGIVLWQILGDPSSAYFPTPSAWYEAILPLILDWKLQTSVLWTALSFAVGLTAATIVGTVTGILVGSSRVSDRALGPTLEFLRILPATSLVPVFSLVLGYNMQMKLLLVTLISTWPILLNCRSARRAMSPVLLEVPQTLGLSPTARFFKVILPAMVRPMLLGVRVAAPIGLIVTLLVEILTQVPGLGALIGVAQANYQTARVWGFLVIAGLLGYAVNWLVTRSDMWMGGRLGATGAR